MAIRKPKRTQSRTQATVRYAGTSIGIGSGNAIAYFGLEYLRRFENITFDDPAVAVAMAGALVSVIFLEMGRIGRAIKYVFDRLYPPKEQE